MALLLVFPGQALAQPAAAPSASAARTPEERAAEEAFRRGKDEQKQGHFEEARAAYLQALALDQKAWGALWNLGVMDRKTGHPVDALKHFRTWLQNSQLDRQARSKDREAAAKWIEELTKECGRLTFEGDWPSTVTIDGLSVAPLRDEASSLDVFDVVAGRHNVEARLGARTLKQDFDVAPGAIVKLRFEPEQPAIAALPPKAIPVTPLAPEASVAPADAPHNHARIWATAGLGAGALVLVAGGAYFATRSNAAKDDAEGTRKALAPGACSDPSLAACASLADSVHSQNTNRTLSLVFYGVGAAAAVGAVVTWFVLGDTADKKQSVTPIVTPQSLGAQWTHSF